MHVFVTGTGRCGTVTFSKACQYIENFFCGHETKAGCISQDRWIYPANHIEVDPHLAWTLGSIIERYPDAYYVHLQRHREDVVESWFRRGIQPHSGAAPLMDVIFQTTSSKQSPGRYRESLGLLYDVVNENIASAFQHVLSRHIWLHDVHRGFQTFWEEICAEGDQRRALREFEVRYNAS